MGLQELPNSGLALGLARHMVAGFLHGGLLLLLVPSHGSW